MKNDFSKRTLELWEKVLKKYGQHSYRLAEDGLGALVLTKGCGKTLATGNREIQRPKYRYICKLLYGSNRRHRHG